MFAIKLLTKLKQQNKLTRQKTRPPINNKNGFRKQFTKSIKNSKVKNQSQTEALEHNRIEKANFALPFLTLL